VNKFVLLLGSFLLLILGAGLAQPGKTPHAPAFPYFNDSLKKASTATTAYIGFYQRYISGIRGRSCPMYPSCSNYGLKTFSEKNVATAFVLTSDRLLRCGHDHDNYALTLRPNGFKLLDYPPYDPPPKELYYRRNSYFFAHADTLEDPDYMTFIKHLMNSGYYQEALVEIMRVAFENTAFDVELFTNKMICFTALEEYEKALFDYETKCPQEHKNNDELLFQMAKIQYQVENFAQALHYDTMAMHATNNRFLMARLISLRGLIYAKQRQWSTSLAVFEKLSNYDGYQQLCQLNTAILAQAQSLKHKSPTFAGILSVVPGAGYAYSGHAQTGLSALLVNGLLAYATYSNIKNENYGMGILTGIFNLTFYIGNIQGAVKSTKRFNTQQQQHIINQLEFNTTY
jgi:putative component of membrane protein insertase Oxa1/YidC/SpoIIIJ protein YidD